MSQTNLTGAVSRSANQSHNLFWVTLLSLLVLTAVGGLMAVQVAPTALLQNYLPSTSVAKGLTLD
jgi:hypothetical protein